MSAALSPVPLRLLYVPTFGDHPLDEAPAAHPAVGSHGHAPGVDHGEAVLRKQDVDRHELVGGVAGAAMIEAAQRPLVVPLPPRPVAR